jgi:hypothetical protein
LEWEEEYLESVEV